MDGTTGDSRHADVSVSCISFFHVLSWYLTITSPSLLHTLESMGIHAPDDRDQISTPLWCSEHAPAADVALISLFTSAAK